MANHVRQQIREAVATTLTGLSTTSTRVFQSRLRPLVDADLPAHRGWISGNRSNLSSPIWGKGSWGPTSAGPSPP